jgi:6-phosphogluconolactonase (cycloisomerase 2 family)
MKFRKPGQILLAIAASAIVGLGLTSCGQSNTIDFLYVTANKNATGQIAVYWVDQESGAISPIPDSPYPSGGENPVAEVASPNGKFLYVVNHDDNAIVEFAIGTDAKIYPQKTCNTPGTDPEAIAINSTGTELFIVDTYAPAPSGQAPYSQTNPGPGALVAFKLDPTHQTFSSCTPIANGSQSYWPLGNYPGGVGVTDNGSYVYAVNTGSIVTTTTPPTAGVPVNPPTTGAGSISGFKVNSNGTLAALPNSPFSAGTAPTAMAIDPTSRFLYVTDSAQNQVIEYTIQSTGQLNPINEGLAQTGNFPNGITVDPRGMFVYVTNYTDGTISTYNVNTANGILTDNATPTLKAGPGALCVIVEPALARFIFTANFLENEVSSAELNTVSGSLTTDQNSPYPTSAQPTCVAAVPHGNHSTQNVTVAPTGNI